MRAVLQKKNQQSGPVPVDRIAIYGRAGFGIRNRFSGLVRSRYQGSFFRTGQVPVDRIAIYGGPVDRIVIYDGPDPVSGIDIYGRAGSG